MVLNRQLSRLSPLNENRSCNGQLSTFDVIVGKNDTNDGFSILRQRAEKDVTKNKEEQCSSKEWINNTAEAILVLIYIIIDQSKVLWLTQLAL